MNFKKWKFPNVDKSMVPLVAEECNLDPLVVFIAFARGLCDPYEIEQFFDQSPDFTDPYEYSGMKEAVDRINIALESGEKILIFGDYDCDGVTATALLTSYLKKRGADVDYCVPDRENDGYGISVGAVEKAAREGVTLIITVDNGINAVEEAKCAIELGVDIVVTDHHLPQGELPDAVAVVDPHLDAESDWIFTELCGVGVAFKLVCALEERPCEEMLYEYGDLVTLGTIADVVPLIGENRHIVNIGLKLINHRKNNGIKALIEVSGSKFITSGNTAFTLCPRINAAGRMASADTAIKLLCAENYDEALYFAECLDRFNAERQAKEQDIFESACKLIEDNGYHRDRVIVVDGFGWHVGIIGIVASKLVEKYGKPCIVISNSAEKSVGSGRSVNGFSLFEALKHSEHTLVKFGGHELAAGLTVSEENISQFRRTINVYAESVSMPFAEIKIDCRIKPYALTVDAAKAIKAFEPFGAGNPVPLFAVTESQIIAIQGLAGGKHVRVRLRKEACDYSAVMFGVSPENFAFKVGDTVDVAVTLDVNVYNNTESASVVIRAIRKSGIDEAVFEKQLSMVQKLYSGSILSIEAKEIYPSREDMAIIFRFLRANNGCVAGLAENDLLSLIPIGRLILGLTALTELGLIKLVDGKYEIVPTNSKVDIDSANILCELKSFIGGDNNG